MRDFMASRVVGGRQQIRAAVSFHEDGRLVMWPYGYTMTNVPSDMTAQDRAALATIGRKMASTNGYTPIQASDLYVSSGTSRDYQYGVYRIFSYTFEMSLTDYPDDSRIASEIGRNKEAVLYLMEKAACPLGVLGATVRRRAAARMMTTSRSSAAGTPTPMGRTRPRQPPGSPAGTRPRRPAADAKQLGTVPSGAKALRHGRARRRRARAPTTWMAGRRIRSRGSSFRPPPASG